jgi:D-alanyl-D-alanine carboxypeptidase
MFTSYVEVKIRAIRIENASIKRMNMMRLKNKIATAVMAALIYVPFANAQMRPAPASTASAIQTLLDKFPSTTQNVKNSSLYIATPAWTWEGATGFADGKAEPMTPRHSFRISGMTLPFVTAATLRLMELGKVDIALPIAGYLSDETNTSMRQAGYDPEQITVQHLLSGTSGIYDYFQNDPKFFEMVVTDLTRAWTRPELLSLAMANAKITTAPGEAVGSEVPEYLLLQEIVERRSGMNIGRAVRSLLRFDRLGLANTYWEGLEPKTSKSPFAASFHGETNTALAHPSFDTFGGLVSTTKEFGVFIRALVRGDVFDNRRTLAVLMTATDARQRNDRPRASNNGLTLIKFGRYRCWGLGGFFGQEMAYCPDADVTYAWTINQEQWSYEQDQKFLSALAKIVTP